MYAPADSYRSPGAGGLAPAAASAAGAAHFRQLPVPAEMAARGHPGQRTACHRGGGAPHRGRRHRRRVGPARGQSPYPAGGLAPGRPVGGPGPAGAEQACGHRHPPGGPDGGDRHRGRGRVPLSGPGELPLRQPPGPGHHRGHGGGQNRVCPPAVHGAAPLRRLPPDLSGGVQRRAQPGGGVHRPAHRPGAGLPAAAAGGPGGSGGPHGL